MYTSLKLSIAALCISSLIGCSPASVATTAFKQIRGASSEVREIPGTLAGDFRQFRGARIAPPRTDLGTLVSGTFKGTLPVALKKHLSREKDAPFPGGSPEITIEPEIIWFKDAGVMEAAGSYSYVATLFWLSADGKPLGRLEIVTKEAAARTGDKEKAESMAKKLAQWFQKRRKGKK